jgi:sporulation integral membrane protein YtvI
MECKRTPWYKAFELPALLLFTLALFFLMVKLIRFVLPLIVASILSLLMEPMVRFLSRANGDGKRPKRGLPRKLSVVLTMLLVFSILILLLSLLVAGIINEIINLSTRLPQTLPQLSEKIAGFVAKWRERVSFVSPATLDALTRTLNIVGQRLMEAVGGVATNALGHVTRLPSVLLFIIVMVLSTYFIASDRHAMGRNIARQIPESWLRMAVRLYNTLLKALWGWIRAQLLIMICMFVMLCVGLFILRVRYALLIAACIAVLDALPILGSGLILLPWGLYELAFNQQALGLGLLVLYLVVMLSRQMLEPRIVGVRFGLPPLMTMAAMYAGLQVLGFWGLLLGPMVTLILISVARAYLEGRTYREVIGRGKRR